MVKRLLLICAYFFLQFVAAQDFDRAVVDSLYREDQFYAGVTYNLLGKVPDDVSQSGFSGGYHFGFIRDMPVNSQRNLAFGLGLGISLNSFNQNILVSKDENGSVDFAILEDGDTYTKNKFSMYLVELPFEFRWRTSSPTEYKFWRIYTGFKLGYLLAHTTKYRGDLGAIKESDIVDFNNFQYGLTLSAGYNTWNIHCYFGLNSIFSEGTQVNNFPLDMNSIKIGLMFYIL